MMLIGVAVVVGVGFLSLVYPSVSDLVQRNNLRSLLYNEQGLLVVYREFENETHTCLGFFRLEPGAVSYALALAADSGVDVLSGVNASTVLTYPLVGVNATSTQIDPSRARVYCLFNGDYSPCIQRFNRVSYVPAVVIENYVAKGVPALLCLNKTALSELAGPGPSTITLYFFMPVGKDYYEVGEVKLSV